MAVAAGAQDLAAAPSCAGRYGLSRQTKARLRWPGGACVPELTAWAVIGA